MSDIWDFWRRSLDGERPETTPGTPHAGYFRDRSTRAIAIWEAEGEWFCQVTSGYQPKHLDEIDELFGFVCRTPITRDLFLAIKNGGQWPEEIPATDRFVTKADNAPPEELAPEQAMAREILALEQQVAQWLDGLPGGKPQTRVEVDLCANYALKFAEFERQAEEAHRVEKEPFLKAGREIDAKWFRPVRDVAAKLKTQIKKIGEEWLVAENKRLVEAARIETERLRKIAEEEDRKARNLAKIHNVAPPAPTIVEEVQPQRAVIGTQGGAIAMRSRKVWIIDDAAKVAAYFATQVPPHPDLVACLQKLVNVAAKAGVSIPGTHEDKKDGAA